MTPEESSRKRDQKVSGTDEEDPFFTRAEPQARNPDSDQGMLPENDPKKESRNRLHDMMSDFYATPEDEERAASPDSTTLNIEPMKPHISEENEDINDFFSLKDPEGPPQEPVTQSNHSPDLDNDDPDLENDETVTYREDESNTETVGEGGGNKKGSNRLRPNQK